MKKKLFTSLSFLFAIVSTFIFASHEPDSFFEECEKTYVEPYQTHIDEEGIFVQLKETWYQTSGLQIDTQGIFFNTIEAPLTMSWHCPSCRKSNLHPKKVCKCGAKRPGRYNQ